MRKGIKTTEFWLGLITALILAVQKIFWPDTPFPAEAFSVVVLWIGARLGEKSLTGVKEERAWATSEFWVAILFSGIKYIWPDMPAGIENFVMVYILGRPTVKVLGGNGITNLLKKE